MAPPKKDDPKGKGTASSSKLSVQKQKRPPPTNFGAFWDASRLTNYNHYFSRRPIAVERDVHEKTLFDTLVGYKLVLGGWESLMIIKGEVQEEAVRVFWSNIHDLSLDNLTFHTEVYEVHMDIDPSALSTLVGITRPTSKVVAFPPEELDKTAISEVFGCEGTT